MIGNQAVPITIRREVRALAAQPHYLEQNASNKQDANKNLDEANAQRLRRFETRVPEKLPADAKNLAITIQLQEGKHRRLPEASCRSRRPSYAIDFFPEGGDLIAGVA